MEQVWREAMCCRYAYFSFLSFYNRTTDYVLSFLIYASLCLRIDLRCTVSCKLTLINDHIWQVSGIFCSQRWTPRR